MGGGGAVVHAGGMGSEGTAGWDAPYTCLYFPWRWLSQTLLARVSIQPAKCRPSLGNYLPRESRSVAPTLSDSMDCSPPGSSVHGILQARILEWVAIPFSRGSSWPRDWTWVPCIAGRFFTIWATREAYLPQLQCKVQDGASENPLQQAPSLGVSWTHLERCDAAQCLLNGTRPRASGNKSDLGLASWPRGPVLPSAALCRGLGGTSLGQTVCWTVQRQGQFLAPPLPEPLGFSPRSWSLARSAECWGRQDAHPPLRTAGAHRWRKEDRPAPSPQSRGTGHRR